MKLVEDWNGKSVSFFAKLEDPPIPLPGLISPTRLFNLVFNADGSFYTSYFGGGREVEEGHVVDGHFVHNNTESIAPGRECRISIHGSGEVRSFIRGPKEILSHLGYEIRSIDTPVLLAQHRIGTAGEYISDLLAFQNPKSTAVVIPRVFENPQRAIFSLHVAPEEYVVQKGNLVWFGVTKLMDNGRRLAVAVEYGVEDWPEGHERTHEVRVFSKSRAAL
jgi:hypothetical protein